MYFLKGDNKIDQNINIYITIHSIILNIQEYLLNDYLIMFFSVTPDQIKLRTIELINLSNDTQDIGYFLHQNEINFGLYRKTMKRNRN